jgi:hypothetical protein
MRAILAFFFSFLLLPRPEVREGAYTRDQIDRSWRNVGRGV